jgi:hypothetical protein
VKWRDVPFCSGRRGAGRMRGLLMEGRGAVGRAWDGLRMIFAERTVGLG